MRRAHRRLACQTEAVFGTVLYDVFARADCNAVHAALEDLCSPLDTYGWASVGIYAFLMRHPISMAFPGAVCSILDWPVIFLSASPSIRG